MIRAAVPLALLAGCAQGGGAVTLSANDPALLTALFLDARSIEPQLARDFACAGIENAGTEEDPPLAVLDALRAKLGKVVPQSACRRDDQTSLVVGEGVSGSGTWLTIGDVDCSDGKQCRATVSYYVANQGAGGREVVATRSPSGWRIASNGLSWIS